MITPDLPEIPPSLKSIQQYLKIASTHDQRDCVVSYWSRLYALQTGLKLSTKTAKETNFLLKLMNWLEETKKELHDNEAITNEVAAQAHLENWALKLFLYADRNDRAANFGKNVVQSFYTAGLLYDVLTVFGELSEEALQNRKYAKWKAAYIHNCLKNGETPVPGPMKDDDEDLNLDEAAGGVDSPTSHNPPGAPDFLSIPSTPSVPPAAKPDEDIATPNSNPSTPTSNITYPPLSDFSNTGPKADQTSSSVSVNPVTEGGVSLSPDQMAKAQKYIKWAGSSLNFDDVSTAIMNLRKALHLLSTGQDLG